MRKRCLQGHYGTLRVTGGAGIAKQEWETNLAGPCRNPSAGGMEDGAGITWKDKGLACTHRNVDHTLMSN